MRDLKNAIVHRLSAPSIGPPVGSPVAPPAAFLARFLTRFLAALLAALAVMLAAHWPQTAHAQEEKSGAAQILDRDYARLLSWLPGTYDNMEQFHFAKHLKLPEDQRHRRAHYAIEPFQTLGEGTFKITRHRDDDTAKMQVFVVRFVADYAADAIRMVTLASEDGEAWANMEEADASRFQAVKACDLLWRYQNAHYSAHLDSEACPQGQALVASRIQLSQRALWLSGGSTQSLHFEKNDRARHFNCFILPKKKAGGYTFYNNLTIHDQGGWIRIAATDEHERVAIHLRRIVWPMGVNRPATVLYAYRGDNEERAESYSWTSYDEPRIGVNFRWIQASCTAGDAQISPSIDLKTGAGK